MAAPGSGARRCPRFGAPAGAAPPERTSGYRPVEPGYYSPVTSASFRPAWQGRAVDAARLLRNLTDECHRFADLATRAEADSRTHVRVPACDTMTVSGLVRHLGSVHRVAAAWVRDNRRPDTWENR